MVATTATAEPTSNESIEAMTSSFEQAQDHADRCRETRYAFIFHAIFDETIADYWTFSHSREFAGMYAKDGLIYVFLPREKK